jgi:asparagine synthase (glutamine-hydrolysing)
VCGYIGHFSTKKIDIEKLLKVNSLITCRGPDQTKQISEVNNTFKTNFSFIFNRLSIIDLSTEAEQPMHSKKYQTSLLFNGEIYNHRELRVLLEKDGLNFSSSHSDSEVVLLGISHYGEKFVEKMVGQFAIVFYDHKNNTVLLIKDRLAQKPLYYLKEKNDFIFSSNLLSIVKYKNSNLSEKSVIDYFNFGVVPSPQTLFENIFKVKPGEIVKIDLKSGDLSNYNYWNLYDFIDNKKYDEHEFQNLLLDAIKIRQEADVDIAHFLSGGLDSTYIIKNLRKARKDTNTYSVGFDNKKYDETRWQNKVAQKYSTNHTYSEISGDLSFDLIDQTIEAFDEPYADSSSIPSFLIAQDISKKYKVAISGDGGDELLGGYTRFINSFNKTKSIDFSSMISFYPSIFGSGLKLMRTSKNIYKSYSYEFSDMKLLNMLKLEPSRNIYDLVEITGESLVKDLMMIEYRFYLSEMMMLKIDRTSMANSLEVRSPFVDHRLVEFALGHKLTFDNHLGKIPIKFDLSRDFNKEFINRHKKGFSFQLENWIYPNINVVSDVMKNGKVINQLDKKIINKLSLVKSRTNAERIWKLYFLERFLASL